MPERYEMKKWKDTKDSVTRGPPAVRPVIIELHASIGYYTDYLNRREHSAAAYAEFRCNHF
jgi:hypothetical protein